MASVFDLLVNGNGIFVRVAGAVSVVSLQSNSTRKFQIQSIDNGARFTSHMFRMPASNGNDESPTTKHNNTHCPIITAVTHWAGSNVSLVIMLLEVSQWSWKEDNGAI
jgi:hypothetical protein